MNLCNPEHYDNNIKNVMIVLMGVFLFSGLGGERVRAQFLCSGEHRNCVDEVFKRRRDTRR